MAMIRIESEEHTSFAEYVFFVVALSCLVLLSVVRGHFEIVCYCRLTLCCYVTSTLCLWIDGICSIEENWEEKNDAHSLFNFKILFQPRIFVARNSLLTFSFLYVKLMNTQKFAFILFKKGTMPNERLLNQKKKTKKNKQNETMYVMITNSNNKNRKNDVMCVCACVFTNKNKYLESFRSEKCM